MPDQTSPTFPPAGINYTPAPKSVANNPDPVPKPLAPKRKATLQSKKANVPPVKESDNPLAANWEASRAKDCCHTPYSHTSADTRVAFPILRSALLTHATHADLLRLVTAELHRINAPNRIFNCRAVKAVGIPPVSDEQANSPDDQVLRLEAALRTEDKETLGIMYFALAKSKRLRGAVAGVLERVAREKYENDREEFEGKLERGMVEVGFMTGRDGVGSRQKD